MSQDALHNTLQELERALTRPRGNPSGEGDFTVTGPCGEAVIPEGYEGAGTTVRMKAHKIKRPGASPSFADIRTGDLSNEWWARGQTRLGDDGEAIQCVPHSLSTSSSSYVEKPERTMSEREKLLRRLEDNTSAINAMVMHSAATDCSSLSTPGTCGATAGRCMWGPTQKMALDGIDETVTGPPVCHPTVAEQLQECATEAQRIRKMTLKTLDAQAALKSKYHDIIQADVTTDIHGRIVMDQKKARDMYSQGELPAVTKKVGEYSSDARRIQLQQAMTTAHDESATSELRDITRSVAHYNKAKADDDMCKLRFENGVTGAVKECFEDDNGESKDDCVIVSTGQSASTVRGIRDDADDSRVYERESLKAEENSIRPHNSQCRAKSAEGVIWQATPAVYDSGISQSVMNSAGVDGDLIRKAENDLTGDSAVDTDAGAMAFPILSARTANNSASDSINTDLLEAKDEKFGMNERAPLAQMLVGGSYPQRMAVENLWERMKNATATDITSIDSMDIMQEDLLANPEHKDHPGGIQDPRDYHLKDFPVTTEIAHVAAQAGGNSNSLENFSLYHPNVWPLYTDIFKSAHKGLDTGGVCVPVPFNHFQRFHRSQNGSADQRPESPQIRAGAVVVPAPPVPAPPNIDDPTYGAQVRGMRLGRPMAQGSIPQNVTSNMLELMAPSACWNYAIGPPPSLSLPMGYITVRAKVNRKRGYPIMTDRVKIHPSDLKILRTTMYREIIIKAAALALGHRRMTGIINRANQPQNLAQAIPNGSSYVARWDRTGGRATDQQDALSMQNFHFLSLDGNWGRGVAPFNAEPRAGGDDSAMWGMTYIRNLIHVCDGSCFEVDEGEDIKWRQDYQDFGTDEQLYKYADALVRNAKKDYEDLDSEFQDDLKRLLTDDNYGTDLLPEAQLVKSGRDDNGTPYPNTPLWIGTYTGTNTWLRENLNRLHPTVFYQLGAGPKISALVEKCEGQSTSDDFYKKLERHMKTVGYDLPTNLRRFTGQVISNAVVQIGGTNISLNSQLHPDGSDQQHPEYNARVAAAAAAAAAAGPAAPAAVAANAALDRVSANLGVIAQSSLGETDPRSHKIAERELILAPREVIESILLPPNMIFLGHREAPADEYRRDDAACHKALQKKIVQERKNKKIPVLPIEMYTQMVRQVMFDESDDSTRQNQSFPDNVGDGGNQYSLNQILSGLATNTKLEAQCQIELEGYPTVQHTFMDQDVKDWSFLPPGAHHMVSTGLPVGPVGLFPGTWRAANDGFLLTIVVKDSKDGNYTTTSRISSSKGFRHDDNAAHTKFTDCVNIHSGFVCRCQITVNLRRSDLDRVLEPVQPGQTGKITKSAKTTPISEALQRARISPKGILQLQLRMLSDGSGPTGRVTRHITGKPLTAKNITSRHAGVNIDRDLGMTKVNPTLLSGRYHSVHDSSKDLVALDILYDAVGIKEKSTFEGNTNRIYLHAGGSLRVRGSAKKLYGASTKKWTELGTSGARELLDWYSTPDNTTAGISVAHAEIDASTKGWVPTYGPRSTKLHGGMEVEMDIPANRPQSSDLYGVGRWHGAGLAGSSGSYGQSIMDIAKSVVSKARFAYGDEMKAIDSVLVAHQAFPHVPPMTLRHALSPSSPFKSTKFRCLLGFRVVGDERAHDFYEWIPHENRPWYVMLPTVVNVPSLTFVPDMTTQPFTKTGVPYSVGSVVRVVLQGEGRPRHARIIGYDPSLSSYEMMVSDDGINPDTGRLMHLSTIGGHHRILSEVRGTPPATTSSGHTGRAVQQTFPSSTGVDQPRDVPTTYGYPHGALPGAGAGAPANPNEGRRGSL